MSDPFQDHLKSGTTRLCHCWRITRRDGVQHGFTDHDLPLQFRGTDFEPASGLTATALQQTSGISADNSSVVGALNSDKISAELLRAGVFDDASLEIWRVHWPDPNLRELQFRGTIGEISLSGDQFTAEVRSATDLLERPFGRVIQAGCSAVLGDTACGIDLDAPGRSASLVVEAAIEGRVFICPDSGGLAPRALERGRLIVETGDLPGQRAVIKRHEDIGGKARIELWEAMRISPVAGDRIKCFVGCDKTLATCRDRYGNQLNFRGFPQVPGEDWLFAYPKASGGNTGGSLQS